MRTVWVGSTRFDDSPTISAELPPAARGSLAIGEHLLVRAVETPTQEVQVTAVHGPQVTLAVLGRTAAAVNHDRNSRGGTVKPAESDISVLVTTTVPSGVGARFRRPLTDTELTTVKAWIAVEGGSAGIRALWNVLRWAADGVTYDAREVDNEVDRQAYAIPTGQAQLLVGWLKASPRDLELIGTWRWERQVDYLWTGTGPASYDESTAPAVAPYPSDPLT